MSGLLAGKVWQSNLDGTLKPLAACLADIANDDGTRIFPSVEYICWLTGKSLRAIQYQLRALEEMGVLEVVSEPTGKAGEFKEYQMIETKLPKRKTWRAFKAGAKSASSKPEKLGAKKDGPGAISAELGAKSDISPYIDPSLTVITPQISKLPRPRQPDSDDEVDEKQERFSIEEMKEPRSEIEQFITTTYPSLPFKDYYKKWYLSRYRQGGLKGRAGKKATLRQYSADLELYFLNCLENQQKQLASGQKPSDYRGPVRNTETAEQKRKREECPDCFGTGTILTPKGAKPCKHERSPA